MAQTAEQLPIGPEHLAAFDRLIQKGAIRPDTYLFYARVEILRAEAGKLPQSAEEVRQISQFFKDGETLFEHLAQLYKARDLTPPKLNTESRQVFNTRLKEAKKFGLYV